MTLTITRRHLIAALIVVIVGGGGAFAAVRLSANRGGSTPKVSLPSVMQCTGKVQSEPTSYVLACADYNSELLKIHWTSWTSNSATAKATYSFNDCTPYCAAGKFHSYPASVRLSSPHKTKSGLLFSEVSIAYIGPSGRKAFNEDLPTTLFSGISSTATTAPAPVGSGYLNTGSTSAAFIQWNTNASAVSGTIQLDYIEGTPPNEQLSSNTEPVSGQINGSPISLSIDGAAAQFGTISGGSFTLDVPQSDGTLAPALFSTATATQFNQAVAGLNGTVASANRAADQAAAAANHASAVAQAEQQVQSDVSTVESGISDLSSDVGAFSGDLSQMKQDVATTGNDLSTTQSAAATVKGEAKQYPGGNSGEVCGDAGTVEGDAGTVDGDAGTVEGDAGTVEANISTVENDESTLQSDDQQYVQDLAAVPGYSVSGAPSRSSVKAALKSASGAISSAIASSNQVIATANADVTAAYAAANSASQAGNCAAGESAPSPETTIPS